MRKRSTKPQHRIADEQLRNLRPVEPPKYTSETHNNACSKWTGLIDCKPSDVRHVRGTDEMNMLNTTCI